MRTVFIMLLLLVLASPATAADKSLVAWWTFEEGKGAVLHDKSGNGNHGSIHGAKWVANGTCYALEFDGKDDYMDCGEGKGFDIPDQITIEAWIYPLSAPGPEKGETPILGKIFDSYFLTHYREGSCYFYIGGGGNNATTRLKERAWNHLVACFDGASLRMYLDGRIAAQSPSKVKTIPQIGSFRMGNSAVKSEYIRDAHFHGRLAEVRVYDRVLGPEEVAEHYRTTNLNGAVTLKAVPVPLAKKVFVELDARGLGRAAVSRLVIAIHEKGSRTPVLKKRVTEWDRGCRAHVPLDAERLRPGAYVVTALAKGAGVATDEITWWSVPAFPRGKPGAIQLNNLVTELLNVKTKAHQGLCFNNPRNGWVYVSSSRAVSVNIRGHGREVAAALVKGPGNNVEAMHCLPAGPYTVSADGATELIVRAIPRLAFCKFPESTRIKAFGWITWDVFKKRWFDNTNVVIGQNFGTVAGTRKACGEAIEEWLDLGRRWIIEMPGTTPYLTKSLGVKITPDGLYDYLANSTGLRYPGLSGVLLDEFESSDSDEYVAWHAATDRIHAEPRFAGRNVQLYCGSMVKAKRSKEWLKDLIGQGSPFCTEFYCQEMPTQGEAWDYLDKHIIVTAREHEEKLPGSIRSMVIVWCMADESWEMYNNFPSVNGNVYAEMQLHLAANAPELLGMRGFHVYGLKGTTPEMQRWVSRLYRHYGIEGKTEMLSKDPYLLNHIQNPDFDDGTAGWTIQEAQKGSVKAGFFGGFGALQGRSPLMGAGNNCLIMKRSAKGPNRFSQTIRNLQAGRTYSVRMFTGDRKKMRKETHAVRIEFGDVEELKHLAVQEPTYNYFSGGGYGGGYAKKNLAWPNFHWRVFRAKGTTAKLTVSDWRDDPSTGSGQPSPGGPIGQELMYNFIEVKPYFMSGE